MRYFKLRGFPDRILMGRILLVLLMLVEKVMITFLFEGGDLCVFFWFLEGGREDDDESWVMR